MQNLQPSSSERVHHEAGAWQEATAQASLAAGCPQIQAACLLLPLGMYAICALKLGCPAQPHCYWAEGRCRGVSRVPVTRCSHSAAVAASQ